MDAYSYCVLRYVHDPVAGEAINVGVLFYARDVNYVRFLSEPRTRALSGLFAGFDRDSFQSFLGHLNSAVQRLQFQLTDAARGMFGPGTPPADVGEIARVLLADNDLRFGFGSIGAGVTRDVVGASQAIFERMVLRQRPQKKRHQRRDDDAVWGSFQAEARLLGITKVLGPHIVITPEFPIAFDHAFPNEKWHAIEPLSFDYADADDIQKQATRWLGNGLLLGLNPDFGGLYLLLGEPELASQKGDFIKACNVLRRLPIKPKIYREDQAKEMAEEIAAFMKEHGLLSEESATI